MSTTPRRDLLWNKSKPTLGSLVPPLPQKNFLSKLRRENKTPTPSTRLKEKKREEQEGLLTKTDTEVSIWREKKELKKKKCPTRLS